MKEIKCRAWEDKTARHRMFCWEEIRYSFSDYLDSSTDTFIMQYTGLKDKNGVEIYEGDILNIKSTVDNNWLKKEFQDQTIVVVSFQDGAFVDDYTKVLLYDKIRTITSFKKDVWTQYEVIGNIYQNAEPLECQ